MPTTMTTDTTRLAELLDEALILADALQLPIAAIHIEQARAHLDSETTEA